MHENILSDGCSSKVVDRWTKCVESKVIKYNHKRCLLCDYSFSTYNKVVFNVIVICVLT
jgi:hypothetical protein